TGAEINGRRTAETTARIRFIALPCLYSRENKRAGVKAQSCGQSYPGTGVATGSTNCSSAQWAGKDSNLQMSGSRPNPLEKPAGVPPAELPALISVTH